MFCREQVAQLRDIYEEVRALDSEVVAIGSGQPFQAKAFAEEREIPFPLLVDPELTAYRAAQLKRPRLALLKPAVYKSGLRALRNGFRQGRTEGDAFQTGGAFVLGPADAVHYAQISKHPGDHADPAELLEELRRACAGNRPS